MNRLYILNIIIIKLLLMLVLLTVLISVTVFYVFRKFIIINYGPQLYAADDAYLEAAY